MRSNEVAKVAGVTVRTLRHYHQLGLLPEPARTANGYRDYSAADVARVLRIKRLASLGFPLARVGEIMAELDDPRTSATSALDELDHELTLQIEHLQEQSRVIAELREAEVDPDLPVRFGRILRDVAGVDILDNPRPSDRTALLLASHLYTEEELQELEAVVASLAELDLADSLADLDDHLNALPADAPEPERAALAEESLTTLAPLIARFNAQNWLRPYTTADHLLDEIVNEDLNPAQQDVYDRIFKGIEDIMRQRADAEPKTA